MNKNLPLLVRCRNSISSIKVCPVTCLVRDMHSNIHLPKRYQAISFLFILLFFLPFRTTFGFIETTVLYGVVDAGELCLLAGTGCTDEGKLVRFDNGTTNQPAIVGRTYADNLSSLAFDPIGRRLIVGKRNGQIGILNKETGMGQGWIVLNLHPDPSPPAGLSGFNLSPDYLHAMDFDPAGNLYAELSTHGGTEFLAFLDLDAVDPSSNLEIDIIGVIGSTDNGVFSNAPFGFQEVYGIAFDPTSGELCGVGKKLPIATTPAIHLIKINTQPVPVPDFATEVGPLASGIISGARAMAATPNGEFFVSANAPGVSHVLVSFNIHGIYEIKCDITSLDGQISGLATITEFEPSGRPPKINSFDPLGGKTRALDPLLPE